MVTFAPSVKWSANVSIIQRKLRENQEKHFLNADNTWKETDSRNVSHQSSLFAVFSIFIQLSGWLVYLLLLLCVRMSFNMFLIFKVSICGSFYNFLMDFGTSITLTLRPQILYVKNKIFPIFSEDNGWRKFDRFNIVWTFLLHS